MRKLFLMIALFLLFGAIAGCGTNEPASPQQSRLSSSQTEEAITTPTVDQSRVTFEPWANHNEYIPDIQISWGDYRTLVDLCMRMQNIAVVTVEDIEVFVTTTEEMLGTKLLFHETMVKYTVNID